MFVVVFAGILILALAGVLLAVVATSAGRLQVRHARWGRVVQETSRHLNGQGDVPRFLERLDNGQR